MDEAVAENEAQAPVFWGQSTTGAGRRCHWLRSESSVSPEWKRNAGVLWRDELGQRPRVEQKDTS